ncbi:winged helix-turn-helix domain-containing protein [Microbacterium sp. APC 3901]|uniref:winged helix-turn-helix domain-containing protein n=1 Tax=Microbacterium sp. APC 3901 TaxID=3035192 RepID=UPI0025B4F133|nr:winged helix-turn-helix domain-containing protein [Microbacterium sp. APC 3901]MDN3443936.1 winged helix-turn-helix domain-containing protein [Microbacterium sp. APC 3901]
MTPARTLDTTLAGCAVVIADECSTGDLDAMLSSRGATVRRAVVEGPGANELGEAAIRAAAGEVDAVILVSTSAAAYWVEAADRADALESIRSRAGSGRLLLVSSGAGVADRLRDAELRTAVSDHEGVTSSADRVIEHFGRGGAPSLPTDAGLVEVRSGGVIVDGVFVPLSRSAVALIDALAAAGGRVISRAELGAALPGRQRTPHAVEAAVARLREALGQRVLVHTVVKRGYRLAVTDT